MTKYKKNLIFYLLIAVISLPLWGRDYVHVFTSKGIYETSEDLWFKCIAFDENTMVISDQSHTAYVEIIGPSDSVVWREKYRMSNGMCDGHVYVGDDWEAGEYRMFVHTRGSLGGGDTVLYPKHLLIVKELREAPGFLSSARERMQFIDVSDTMETAKLNVTVTLDSVEYHTRSKVKATVRVKDAAGNPVRAVLALSVADALCSYPLADVDIESQAYAILHDTVRAENRILETILSDSPVSGHLKSRRKNNTIPLHGQYINVFDESVEKGAVNIISTGTDGYFEVSPDICSSLGKNLLVKPLVDQDMKPKLVLNDPFQKIDDLRLRAIDRYFPIIRKSEIAENEETDDYSDRHTIRLEEVVVKGKNNYYSRRKKDKLMSFLDSLAMTKESAWVCCGKIVNGEYVGGWLNDYLPGYNHHPIDDPYYQLTPPHNVRKPEHGKLYKMIKMRWNENRGCYDYEQEAWAVYAGPRYSDEDLLEMEGLSKSEGYYPKKRFSFPSDEELTFDFEDFRNTLVWLPRAQTDENGEFTFEFRTSDIKSNYRISGLLITHDIKDARTINEYFKVK
ncbi:MAG: hypothetical protein K2G85_07530 [Muribaculaceae bacterium]|nr:hypothetical protein [Muribaculaceae bacterium]